jgi:hypothetical protein
VIIARFVPLCALRGESFYHEEHEEHEGSRSQSTKSEHEVFEGLLEENHVKVDQHVMYLAMIILLMGAAVLFGMD